MKCDRTKAGPLTEIEDPRGRAAELERANAELTRRLERARGYSEALLDAAPLAITVCDLEGVIVDANKAALAASARW